MATPASNMGVDIAKELIAPAPPTPIDPVSATGPQAPQTGDLIRESVSKSMTLADSITAQLQADLGVRQEAAEVTANAITTAAKADKLIALQTDTENLRVQNQLRRVAEESTSEENQTRLMAQMHNQAQDIQIHLEEREKEADEGGFGYAFKSMLNMEIYGTPGGRDDLELAAKGSQYQATVQELQGITTAVTNFETANQKTRELVTDATIHANQQKLSAQAQLDLRTARLAMLKDNAEQMQLLLSADKNRLSTLNSLLNYENSVEVRADRKQQREQIQQQLALQRESFDLQRIGVELDNQRKILENAIDAGDAGLAARTKLQIKTQQANLEALNRKKVKEQITDPLDIEAKRANVESLTRENIVSSITAPTRVQQTEANLEVVNQQKRLTELALIQAEGTAEQKLNAAREAALLQGQVASIERAAVLQSATTVGVAQEALYGFKEDPEVLATGVRLTGAKGTKYDMLEAIGTNMVAGNRLSLGDTPYKAWINYQALTSDGSTMRDLPFVKSLQEVANRLEANYSDPDSSVTRPTEPEAVAKAFNDEAAAYIKEFASNVKTGDATNPMQADPYPILEQKAPGLLQDPLYKEVKKTGQIESDPRKTISTAVNSIISGAVTLEQAADGIANIYGAAGFNTEFYQYGLEAGGFQVPPTYNIVLPSPKMTTLVGELFDIKKKNVVINLMDRSKVMLYLTRLMTTMKAQGKPTTSAEATQSAVDRAGVNNAIATPGVTQ